MICNWSKPLSTVFSMTLTAQNEKRKPGEKEPRPGKEKQNAGEERQKLGDTKQLNLKERLTCAEQELVNLNMNA